MFSKYYAAAYIEKPFAPAWMTNGVKVSIIVHYIDLAIRTFCSMRDFAISRSLLTPFYCVNGAPVVWLLVVVLPVSRDVSSIAEE